MYSQNNEDQVIASYFGEKTGTLLDIGANDGRTFSNSLRLIELGWSAVLVEPSPTAFKKLERLHAENDKVRCIQLAVGNSNSEIILHESGHHLPDKSDFALLSTTKPQEKARWKGVEFKEVPVKMMDYASFSNMARQTFDFISIDAEGLDYEILTQIDLSNVRAVCVEHNSIEEQKYIDYCQQFGMKKIYSNAENLIMVK